MPRAPPRSTLFPTPPLSRSAARQAVPPVPDVDPPQPQVERPPPGDPAQPDPPSLPPHPDARDERRVEGTPPALRRERLHHGVVDRKSARLNSSHSQISYAVF